MSFPPEKLFKNEKHQITLQRILKRVFLDDWLIKCVAMVITAALWLGVTGLRSPTTERLRNITLRPRVSDQIEVTNISAQEVDLLVTGDRRKIEQIKVDGLIVSLDLTDVQSGDRSVQLTPENVAVELPAGVRLEELQPNKIAVKLEKIEEKEIAVKVETEGSVAGEFEIYGTTISPPMVLVRGPESIIKSLDFVATERIELKNQQSDFTVLRVPLNIVNSEVKPLDTTVADVAFQVGEKRIERLFVIPIQAENKRATVVLYGARSVVESLKPEDLRVENVKNEAGENTLKLNLPPEKQDKIEIRKLK